MADQGNTFQGDGYGGTHNGFDGNGNPIQPWSHWPEPNATPNSVYPDPTGSFIDQHQMPPHGLSQGNNGQNNGQLGGHSAVAPQAQHSANPQPYYLAPNGQYVGGSVSMGPEIGPQPMGHQLPTQYHLSTGGVAAPGWVNNGPTGGNYGVNPASFQHLSAPQQSPPPGSLAPQYAGFIPPNNPYQASNVQNTQPVLHAQATSASPQGPNPYVRLPESAFTNAQSAGIAGQALPLYQSSMDDDSLGHGRKHPRAEDNFDANNLALDGNNLTQPAMNTSLGTAPSTALQAQFPESSGPPKRVKKSKAPKKSIPDYVPEIDRTYDDCPTIWGAANLVVGKPELRPYKQPEHIPVVLDEKRQLGMQNFGRVLPAEKMAELSRPMEDAVKSGHREDKLSDAFIAGVADFFKDPSTAALRSAYEKDFSRRFTTKKARTAPDSVSQNQTNVSASNHASAAAGFAQAVSPPTNESPQTDGLTSEDNYHGDDSENKESDGQGMKDNPVRPAIRPRDPVEGAAWDAIGYVCARASNNAKPLTTAEAVQAFGNFVYSFHEKAKDIKLNRKTARENKRTEEAARLKDELVSNRQLLRSAVDAAVSQGDDIVLAHLGQHQKFLITLMTALKDAVNDKQQNEGLSKSILRLMSLSTTTKQEVLAKMRFDAVEENLMMTGDEEVRQLVKTIAAKVVKGIAAEQKAPAVVHSAAQSTTGPKSGSSMPRVAAGLSAKRPQGEITDTQISRKPASLSSATTGASGPKLTSSNGVLPASSSLSQAKPVAAKPAAQPSTAQAKPSTSNGLLPGKSRPVAKPTPRVDAISKTEPNKIASVSKTDGTSSSVVKSEPTRPETAKVDLKFKKAPSAKATKATASQPNSSILGAILDEIERPAKRPAPTPDSDSTSGREESAEQVKARLRKAERRLLRVRFKPDDELTEIRTIERRQDEDEGRASNMIRDASDDKSEGQILKLGMKLEDEDEDEDELPYRPYFAPTPINFSTIPQQTRNNAYVTRGGVLPVQSEQTSLMTERESRELMAVYTDPADIPPTPKSPLPVFEASSVPLQETNLPINDPKFEEIHRRWYEFDDVGAHWAIQLALNRVAERKQASHGTNAATVIGALNSMAMSSVPSSSANEASTLVSSANGQPHRASVPSYSTQGEKDTQVLAMLGSDRVRRWRDPDTYDPAQAKTTRRSDYPDPELQTHADRVEDIVEKLKDKPWPPTGPPEWMQSYPERMQEWWEGYNRDKHRQVANAQQEEQPSLQPSTQGGQDVQVASLVAQAQAQAQAHAPAQSQNPQEAQQQQQQQYAQAWANYYLQQSQAAQSAQTYVAGGGQLNDLLARLAGGSPAAPQNAPPANRDQNDQNAQVQALLAQLGLGGAAAQQPAQNGAPSQDAATAYLMQLAGLQQPQAGDQQGMQHGESARHPESEYGYVQGQQHKQPHHRQKGHSSEGGSGRGSNASSRRDNTSSSSSIPPHLRGINRALIGTKPCAFWAKGQCSKGDKCTFRHD